SWDGDKGTKPDDARLDGMTDETTLTTDSALLHGRVALYMKARVEGGKIAKYLNITAQADSAKQSELEDFLSQVVDPNRLYPVYGDSSLEVQDVRARNKFYLLIESDDKKERLMVGNFRSQLKGIELLNYDRALYGGELDFQRKLTEKTETTVKGF